MFWTSCALSKLDGLLMERRRQRRTTPIPACFARERRNYSRSAHFIRHMKDYLVRISGLRKHAELNGKLGKVVGAVRDSQGGWRVRVSVADGGTQPLEDESHLPTRNLKLKNLKLQPEAPSTGAEHKVEMRATRRCGRGIFATEDLSRGELVLVGSASSLCRDVRDQWICNFNHSCSPNTFSYLNLAGAEEYIFVCVT